MSGNKILVTGGAGFIGGHLTEALIKRGDKVVGLDNVCDYYNVAFKRETLKILETYNEGKDAADKPFTFYEISFNDAEAVDKLFAAEGPFSCVVHLGAQAGVRYSVEHPAEVVRINVEGQQVILDAVKKFKVPYAVCASSSSVYGASSVAPFSEDQKCDLPVSPYAATKRSCELLAHAFCHLTGIPVTMLRFFTVYGPRGRPDMAAFKFIDKIGKGQPIDKYGDGSAIREFTYVDDIVNGVVLAIDKVPTANKGYRLMNLGGGTTHTLNEFIATIEKHVGKEAIINQMPDQPGDVPITSACQKHAFAEVGFKPDISLDEGIRRTVAWYKDCPYV
ncbi:unnamed protein product [Amoebophrya sp. A25]|nr:unnamed protein product [Amoebophrya sp. A25]|eukprot:GSA25T00026932001.1